MKFNEILECFNKTLKDNVHFIGTSKWEQKFGPVKTATTKIYRVEGNDNALIIDKEYTTSIPSGHEDALVEQCQKNALIDFIKYWSNDSRIR